MKEVARCLSKLLNLWNGLSNPCIMGKDVEIVETPLKDQQLELAVRSNLMELMVQAYNYKSQILELMRESDELSIAGERGGREREM